MRVVVFYPLKVRKDLARFKWLQERVSEGKEVNGQEREEIKL